MHPQIVRNAPGNCPIFGMALEPKEQRLDFKKWFFSDEFLLR